jgi:Zn-dependent peptidase ImmA (M78 family)/transcriptional regulator with XRE-family HTH domain
MTEISEDFAIYAAASDFNPDRLILAREAQGMRQQDLAERVEATQSAISQFESGAVKPSPETVARLSLALGYPPEFFSQPLGSRLDPERCHFRKLRGTTKREQRQVLARGDLLLAVVEALEEHVVFPAEQISQCAASVASFEDIEALAERLREAWSLGLGPIANMVDLLERLGVLVLELRGHSRALDAFSTWLDDRPLVFLSNEKDSASRRRFDCAHELGHLLMHGEADPGNRELEDEANRFAGAFLLPAASFSREYPKRLSWGHLRALKKRWKVSLAAIIKRAYDLELISEATYRRAYVRLSQAGWRETEPDEPTYERGRLIADAVRKLAESGLRQIADLADAIAVRQRTLRDLLTGTEPQPALSLSLS